MRAIVLAIGACIILASCCHAANTVNSTFALTVSPITLLGLNNPGVTFTVASPDTAGAAPAITGLHQAETRLQYTSLRSAGASRSIHVTAADLTGLTLKASITANPIPGTGDTGHGLGTVDTHAAQNLITGIRSCHTGSGSTDGAAVTYSLELDEATFASIKSGTFNTTVTYTLQDD